MSYDKKHIYDNLPDDILDKCYSKIIYPQSSYLLCDIIKNAKFVIIKKLIKCPEYYIKKSKMIYYDECELSKIYYKLLYKWYELNAYNFINELDNDYEGILDLIMSGNRLSCIRRELWIKEIYEISEKTPIDILINISNDMIK
tara:strand:- start:4269 stop:4697 length:429 start_codon:yes stop_codon:yes gene_type:complete